MNVIIAPLWTLAILTLAPILIVVIGALTGYIAAWAMPDTFKLWQTYAGMGAFEPWQIGAGLGFIGSFFRATFTKA